MTKKKPALTEKSPAQEQALVPSVQAPTIIKVKLSKAQENLLDILRDPACQILDVTKICKLANVTRATYYNAFKDENFLKAYEAEMQMYRNMNEFQILHGLVEKAKNGKNHNYMHMFFKMQGRLGEQTNKPAIVQVNFNMKRPEVKVDAKVIDVEAEVVDES